MSGYVTLATKYRPQKFADVVGQDIVIRIITSGMMKNRLGSAMLFSGTRGVGKTTIARILARALRCENSNPEPCGKCPACLESSGNSQIDIIEIDAASNTSVDDVREIIESCRYKPSTGKYKIFIIDEVHMLSKSAFNALLKTLEEPPEHVKFLLATTESYKIPETILSRVLKFDLKKVDANLISQYLSSICNQEGIVAAPDVLSLVAKAADGSIRDSLSILDQAINMSLDNEIHIADLRKMLNFSDDTDVLALFERIILGDLKTSIAKYREIIKGNVSCEKIASTFLDYLHAMLCLKSGASPIENEITKDVLEKLKALAKNVSIAALSRIWQMLIRGMEEMKICDRPEIVMEVLIIRVVYSSGLPELHEIFSGKAGGKSDKTSDEKSGEKSSRGNPENQSQKGSDKSTVASESVQKKTKNSDSIVEEALKMFPESVII